MAHIASDCEAHPVAARLLVRWANLPRHYRLSELHFTSHERHKLDIITIAWQHCYILALCVHCVFDEYDVCVCDQGEWKNVPFKEKFRPAEIPVRLWPKCEEKGNFEF